jgi:hypothetical protein
METDHGDNEKHVHDESSGGMMRDFSSSQEYEVYTDEYGMETDGFTDENDDGVIATHDDSERMLTTTSTSYTRTTSPVVAATSSFDSIVAAVAFVATVFGIYELSSICSSVVATASNPHVTSYPTQIDIPVYLLLTTVVGAITLALAIRFLRHPIDTSTGDGDKICKPAGESEHDYEKGPNGRSGRPAVPRDKRPCCDPRDRQQRQTYLRLEAEANGLAASVPRQLRPAARSTSPTLRAFVDQYRRTVAQLDEMDAPIPSVLTLSRMSELAALNDGYVCLRSRRLITTVLTPRSVIPNRTAIGTFGNMITPRQVTSNHRVRSYLTTKRNQGPFQGKKDLLSTRPSRT